MNPELGLELFDKPRSHVIDRHWTGHCLCHTRRLDTVDATRNDQVERGQIHVHVQREAMASHPPIEMNANRGDLSPGDPDPRSTDPTTSSDPKEREGLDQDPFELPKVSVQVATMIGQIQDRVSHQLARAVIGHVATPLHFEKADPQSGQGRLGHQEMAFLPSAPKGDHGGVLEQQQEVPYPTPGPKCRKTALERQRFFVWRETQIDQATNRHCSYGFKAGALTEGIVGASFPDALPLYLKPCPLYFKDGSPGQGPPGQPRPSPRRG